MDLTEWLQDFWKKTEKIGPLEHKAMEFLAKQDSRIAEKSGKALGWDWLEMQGRKNKEDPTRALAHAAQGAAAYFAAPYVYQAYAGAPAAGKAGATAASAAPMTGMFANAGGAGVSAMTQEQLMQQAIQRAMAEQAAQAAAEGVTQGAGEIAKQGMFSGPSFLSSSTTPFAPGMESAGAKDAVLAARETGYLPGNLDFAKEYARADLMNMDQPGEWATRLARNGGRLSGSAAKSMGTQMLMQGMGGGQGRGYQPTMPARGAPAQPPVDQAKVESLKQRVMAGDQAALQELLALLGGKA